MLWFNLPFAGPGFDPLAEWQIWSHQHEPSHSSNESNLWTQDATMLSHVVASNFHTISQLKFNILQVYILCIPRPAGRYLIYDFKRYLTGCLASNLLSKHHCSPAAGAEDRNFASWWGFHYIEWQQNAVLRVFLSWCLMAASISSLCAIMFYNTSWLVVFIITTSKEMAKLGGNSIAVRAAAVVIIIIMRSVDPSLMSRYLRGWWVGMQQKCGWAELSYWSAFSYFVWCQPTWHLAAFPQLHKFIRPGNEFEYLKTQGTIIKNITIPTTHQIISDFPSGSEIILWQPKKYASPDSGIFA